MVGLGNVNNTSDANKPISTATQNALNLLASLASPAFTGTATAANITASGTITAPTINATSFLDVNGNNINTIYAPIAGPTFTGTLAAPTINATTALQVGGTSIASLYQPKPYVAGRVSGTTIKVTTGTQTFTVTNPSTGNYTITWTTAHPNGNNYGIIATGYLTSAVYQNITSTSFQLQPFNPVTGAGVNSEFTFMTVP